MITSHDHVQGTIQCKYVLQVKEFSLWRLHGLTKFLYVLYLFLRFYHKVFFFPANLQLWKIWYCSVIKPSHTVHNKHSWARWFFYLKHKILPLMTMHRAWLDIKMSSYNYRIRLLNLVSMEGMDLAILYNQYHGGWCPGDTRSQGISSHDIGLISQNIPEGWPLCQRYRGALMGVSWHCNWYLLCNHVYCTMIYCRINFWSWSLKLKGDWLEQWRIGTSQWQFLIFIPQLLASFQCPDMVSTNVMILCIYTLRLFSFYSLVHL